MGCMIKRHAWTLAAALGLLTAAALVLMPIGLALGQVKQAAVQPVPPAAPAAPGAPKAPTADTPPADAADLAGATLPTDPKLKRKLEAAGDYVKVQDWAQVAQTVQELLDLPQDVFVQVNEKGPDGKVAPALVGIRVAANRLLGTLPPAGIDVYRTLYGATAKRILQDALASGDKLLFADAAQRYLYTEAGGEAAERLGTLLLDRGDFTVAAQAFERLLQRDGPDKLSPLTLFKAALACHRAGDKETRDRLWKTLAARSPEGLKFGEQTVSLGELEKLLDRYRPSVASSVHDYLQFGGNEGRSAQGIGGPPFLVRRWAQPLTDDGQIKSWLYDGPTSAARLLESRGQAVLPALFPIAATMTGIRDGKQRPVLVYRSHEGIHAVDLRTGKLEWKMPSNWSYANMLKNAQTQQALNQWVGWYKDRTGKPNVLLENATVGSLSTDNTRVYAVDDLQLPPSSNQFDPRFGGFVQPGGSMFFNQVVNDATQHNRLRAIELATGKLKWELGGKRPAGEPERKDARDFTDSYFLGPPLCLGGKLYFLNEKGQELRLVCYDPNRLPDRPSPQDLKDAVLWVQTLCAAKDKILQDYGRRIHATHIAFGEGILVCPTNAGVLLGVDVLSHSLAWAHPYRDPATPGAVASGLQPGMMVPRRVIINGAVTATTATPPGSDWKASAPVVQDGKVVFAAPDGSELRCLNLRNGSKVWGLKRQEDDLYLGGVFAGRVVVVGKKGVRGLALEDGRELWRVETGGPPSGRGVASDNVYYLPLKEAVFPDNERAPAVWAIDVEKGKVVAQTRSRSKDVPGNLVFFDGDVISQGLTEVVAYPQLKVKLQKMNELIAQNPRDPAGLFERGELRLDEGNRAGAVEDLREALANKPPDELAGKVKGKLFEALTELLQFDFPRGEKYLAEYEALCKVAVDPRAPAEKQAEQQAESQRRRANYLALYAKGKEAQGKLVEAFNAYLDFGALGARTQELLSVVDEPSVRAPADVWAQGRIAAMIAAAAPEQRRPLEEAIATRWSEVRTSNDLDRLRNFVTMFGASLPVGREARLVLAERLMEQEGKAALLDAERHLLLLDVGAEDPPTSARALEALARLLTRKGLLEDAAFTYRQLRDNYPQVPVRDGKTGAQLYDELATDKRFIPYLDEPGPVKGPKVKAMGESGNFQMTPQNQVYTFQPEEDPIPFFQRHRVALNYPTNQFKLIDRRTGEERWSEPLKPNNFQYYLNFLNNNTNASQTGSPARFCYQAVGHLIVLNLGQTVVALDPVNQKLLWEKSLLGSQGLTGGQQPQLDPADGTLQIIFPDGYALKIGQAGPVAASYVCLQTRDGLMALDPLTGRTLWTRNDVPPRCRIFGDDRHVYLVELDRNNQAASTRAFRAQDGATVPIANFAALYQKRQRQLGRLLLTTDAEPTGQSVRLYDVHTGKDVWARTFPAGSTLLKSEEPELAGVVAPDGRLTVVNLTTQKDVLGGLVDPKHLQRLQQATLLADKNFMYVAVQQQPANNPWGIWSNLQPGYGLRGLTVNGAFYCFDKKTSKLRWVNEVFNEQLVLDQWKEMPILLFTARYNKPQGPQGRFGVFQVVGVESYDKVTGKTTFYKPELGQNINQFYALNYDVRQGKIELVGHNYRVVHTLEDPAPAKPAKEETPPPQKG